MGSDVNKQLLNGSLNKVWGSEKNPKFINCYLFIRNPRVEDRVFTYYTEDPWFGTHLERGFGFFTVHPTETWWQPSGNTAGKELTTLPHKADGLGQVSSLTSTS